MGTKMRRKQSGKASEGIRAGMLSRAGIRKLARRAGVVRISQSTYVCAEDALRYFLRNCIRDACVYCEHARRITVTPVDVARALKRSGMSLYGIDGADPVAHELNSLRRRRGHHKLASADLVHAHRPPHDDQAVLFRVRNALLSLMCVSVCCNIASLEHALAHDGSGQPAPCRSVLNATLASLEHQEVIFRSGTDIYLLC